MQESKGNRWIDDEVVHRPEDEYRKAGWMDE